MDYFFKYVELNNTFCTIKQEKNAQNSTFFKNHVKNIQFCILYSNFFIHLVQDIIKNENLCHFSDSNGCSLRNHAHRLGPLVKI